MNGILNTKVGLTGILDSTGRFHKCKYLGHCELARKLIKSSKFIDNDDLYICMGSRGRGYEHCSYLSFPMNGKKFTAEQLIWLHRNIRKFDEIQRWLLVDLGKYYGFEIKEAQ